jgi:hypothetical protein
MEPRECLYSVQIGVVLVRDQLVAPGAVARNVRCDRGRPDACGAPSLPSQAKFVHAVMAAGLAVMLVAGLSTIQYLSNPFAGSGAIKPHEMQRTIALMENTKSPVIDLSTLPCDAAGVGPKG